MSSDDESGESLEALMRSIAGEVIRSVEDRMAQEDVEEVAEAIGVDPVLARQWVQTAGQWLRGQTENLGDAMDFEDARSRVSRVGNHILRVAGPHPLDVPTGDQGVALAALDSGRWTIESGSDTLVAHGEGPGPSDALGLVCELRARDWITVDGKVTLVGQHALSRWLASA